ncbi:MAG: bifunctional phosphoribosylaminoimidazolecarboxamide formyltransferase/IMP cyclohydrolase [Elusimicrobiota bacterium]|jgi:phosphoribosylaminoimidazolecarboxamide formyltransferase/IMP cyclohydrolase
MLNIAVFASGEGTDLQALIDACRGRRIRGKIVLVVSSRPAAGALRRAREAGLETLAVPPGDSPDLEAYSARLAAECRRRGVDLVCLAGFLLKLEAPMLEAFPDRILNIHPALLPAFGGKGLYGRRVHEAVLASGARVSGCTVHLIDAVYDHGPIVLQAPVPVLPEDDAGSLAARVLQAEHILYPEAVRLFADERVRVREGRVEVLPCDREDPRRVRRALITVSEKAGVVEFARGLEALGVEIVSTSGTAKLLREAGVEVRALETLTGFPEILGGRVKTLHPRVHGGILMRRADAEHRREAAAHGIEPIDLVAVNLYPFAKAAGSAPAFGAEQVENIDIGGVTLIRAAAKNHEDVAVVVSPADYAGLLAELERGSGRLSEDTRRRLASAAFEHTAAYDAMIARAWSAVPVPAGLPAAASSTPSASPRRTPEASAPFPQRLEASFDKLFELRYGENPHQKAALYARAGKAPSFEQLHGKELSFNNLLDAFGTWEAVSEHEEPAVVVFKHVTPSGVAVAGTLAEALEKAWACDPLSAFGGVLAFNRPVDAAVAAALSKRFVEVLSAPSFEPEALELLKKKPNLRLVRMDAPPARELQLRSLGRETLVYEPDRLLLKDEPRLVTKRAPTPEEERALRFAWAACKYVKSNAIVLAAADRTVGIGAGQMSRVDSVRIAGEKYAKYRETNPAASPLVLAGDAFFPFRDGLDEAARLGVSAVIHPGGSVRDAEVTAAADEHGIAMLLTGVRHFRH